MKRIIRFLTLFGLVLLTATAASATYPAKPVKIILPYATGGGADLLTRVLTQKLAETWGQSVVVDNRPGAGATIGTDMVAKAPADGYTLLMTAGTMAVSPSAYSSLPYDVLKDFAPITTVARSAFVLTVHPPLGVSSVEELLKLARAKPGKINFGSAGNGTMAHLSVELLKVRAGIDVLHVPYKGSNPALNDLLGGQVDAVFDTPAAVMSHVNEKKLKALAVTTPARTPSAPGVPTMMEAGLANYEVSVWFGLLAPTGTPQEIVTKVHADSVSALGMPDVVERLGAQGLEVVTMKPEEFSTFIRAEVGKWREVVKSAGIKFD